jgi:transposase
MLYVGLDLHARTFSVVALKTSGTVLFEATHATSCERLREVIGGLRGPKRVALEETTMAAWAYRVLKPCATEVVVAEPWHNRLIGKDEKCDDLAAARKLADLLRGNFLHPVHHTDDLDRQAFKELVLSYHDTVRELTRAKNRLKGKFRQHGLVCGDGTVYRDDEREGWLAQLPHPSVRWQVEQLYGDLDHLAAKQARIALAIRREARAIPPIRRFQAVPGVGPIRAATFYAILDDPHRFADKRRVWTYCGLGVVRRKSGEKAGPEHLTRHGHPRLKDIAKGAAATAIAAGENAFGQQHARLRAAGVKPESARLTVARAIVSTLWAMWRDDAPYHPRTAAAPVPWPPPPTRRCTA